MGTDYKAEWEKAQRDFERRLEERKNSDSRIQHHKTLTQEEKARGAIDFLTRSIQEHNERSGKEITESEARREATKIAQRSERKDSK